MDPTDLRIPQCQCFIENPERLIAVGVSCRTFEAYKLKIKIKQFKHDL